MRPTNASLPTSWPPAFTLVEMLLASVLAAVLLAAVLAVTAGMGRERQRLAAADEATAGPARPEPLLDLLRRDLANADTVAPTPDGRGYVLVGHGGLHARTLTPTGRLTRVTYRVRDGSAAAGGSRGAADARGRSCLVREQRTLDDPARPDAWADVVAVGVGRLQIGDLSADDLMVDGSAASPADADEPSPARPGEAGDRSADPAVGAGSPGRALPVNVRVRVEFETGAVDRVLRVR